MLDRVFPDMDFSQMSATDMQDIGQYLLSAIPEEEIVQIITLHSKRNIEWELTQFLSKRISEWVLMAEANENNSKVMNFISTL